MFDVLDDLDGSLFNLGLEPLKDLCCLLALLLQIQDKEMPTGLWLVEKHSISYPGHLPLTVMLGIKNKLLSASGKSLFRIF